jgi:protein involved in polysaccharide export with SLBB domain
LIREDKFDPSAKRVGIDAFYKYDREQRERLHSLVNKRIAQISDRRNTEYRIGVGDKIEINVLNFDEISKDYTVLPDGNINIPFIGKIKADGKTERRLTNVITGKLQGYVVDPNVTVQTVIYSAHRVLIVRGGDYGIRQTERGSLSSEKNSFPLKRPNYPLVELLMEVGDIGLDRGGVIYLYPQGNKAGNNLENLNVEERYAHSNPFAHYNPDTRNYSDRARIQIDIEELMGGLTGEPLYVPLLPGDLIVIPSPPLIQVYGEVFARGGYRASGTVGNIKPSLLSVIAASKGFTYSADIHNIEIFRELEFGRRSVLQVDFEELVMKRAQDIKLHDGDIVWVPSHKTRFYEEHSIRAINSFLGTSARTRDSIE